MSYNDQHHAPPAVYPPQPQPEQGYPPQGYPAAGYPPQPAGYPGAGYQQQPPPPVETKDRGDGFWKGCCAALCCCFALDICF